MKKSILDQNLERYLLQGYKVIIKNSGIVSKIAKCSNVYKDIQRVKIQGYKEENIKVVIGAKMMYQSQGNKYAIIAK